MGHKLARCSEVFRLRLIHQLQRRGRRTQQQQLHFVQPAWATLIAIFWPLPVQSRAQHPGYPTGRSQSLVRAAICRTYLSNVCKIWSLRRRFLVDTYGFCKGHTTSIFKECYQVVRLPAFFSCSDNQRCAPIAQFAVLKCKLMLARRKQDGLSGWNSAIRH